jgi:hypothetical protein
MNNKLLVCFALFGLAVAQAKSYTVKLFDTVTAGNVELKAGEYRVDVGEGKAVIRNGTVHGEFNVKIETVEHKYDSTSVRLTDDGGKKHLQEIHLGGTKTKLILE